MGVAVLVEGDATGSGVAVGGRGVGSGCLEEEQAVMNVSSVSRIVVQFVT